MPRSIITLTTDFGLSDHFVGAMKGVILSLAPAATIVDITHEVPPYGISEGAFAIAEAYRYFPKKTVHVVVVDPGVGTARRPLLAEAAGQYFVAPDNGVLSMVYAREKPRVRAITSEKHFRKPVSRTFHGRDVFAPTAALLARGTPAARFGKLIQDYLLQRFAEPVRTGKRFWQGTVLKVDHFGNLITNFHSEAFAELKTRPFQLSCGQAAITELAETFAAGAAGEPLAVVGSSGYLEIAIHCGSAAKTLGREAGAPVDLTVS
jgi:S-adenosylmethionine hydrolase